MGVLRIIFPSTFIFHHLLTLSCLFPFPSAHNHTLTTFVLNIKGLYTSTILHSYLDTPLFQFRDHASCRFSSIDPMACPEQALVVPTNTIFVQYSDHNSPSALDERKAPLLRIETDA